MPSNLGWNKPIHNALISVWDKNGLPALCKSVSDRHVKVYSTEGTARFLKELGFEVTPIEDITRFPEMMDGRVKTLHPKIFGGILARRDQESDLASAREFGIPLFDLVIVNLYPFSKHRGEAPGPQASFIDIGGPSMIRAAAKNFSAVTVLSDPSDYADFIDEFTKNSGRTTLAFRHQMAAKTFARTAHYDSLIADEWFGTKQFPSSLNLAPHIPLRYGENPHQKALWCGQARWKLLQGKELSYNNILDADSAHRLTLEFADPCAVIVKHTNPCGVAIAKKLALAFEWALSCDPKSAFGGIVATRHIVDKQSAQAMASLFLEVVIAKDFEPGAVSVLSARKNLRLIQWENPDVSSFEIRSAMGGWLLQEADGVENSFERKLVTKTAPPKGSLRDLDFAWTVCKHVRSNAIVIAKDGRTIGIGAGQMSRVDSVQLALQKAKAHDLKGSVLASDGFFPFRDNIDLLQGTGVTAVIQPGGSNRDPEVIQACEEHGIAMMLTGDRHFRH